MLASVILHFVHMIVCVQLDLYFFVHTIDIDSGGMVGGPSDVLSQASVVTCIVQANSLNMQTAVPPNCHILV